ncbi:MAG: hypothetical protein KDD64_07300 [Bdellovibrionales bacterium]|nr:hypothetical protein [Bdellovibrionales bacterium]
MKPMFSSRSALKRGEVINQGDSSISLRGEYAERLEFRWLYLCFFSLCFVVYAWSNWSVISVDCLETGDYAANALLVEDAKEFSLLTGPYSRFKFHHPGPALFYYRALGEVLNPIFPSAYACHVFAQYLLNALFFLSAISTILFWSSRPLAVFTYFFTSLFFLARTEPAFWTDIWGPHSIVFAVLCFTVSAASLASGRLVSILPLVIAGTLAAHTHLSVVPLIVVVGLGSLLLGCFSRRRHSLVWSSDEKRIAWSALFVGVVLSLPIVVDIVVHGSESNVFQILSVTAHQKGAHSLWESFVFVSQFFVGPFSPRNVAFSPVWPICLFLGLLFFLSPERGNPFLRALRTIIFVSFVLSVFFYSSIPGEYNPYLAWYLAGVAALGYSTLLAGMLLRITDLFPSRMRAVWSVVWALALIPFWPFVKNPPNLLCNDSPKVLFEKINPVANTVYALTIGQGGQSRNWGEAAGFALELRRRGFTFCVPPRWRFLFGKESGCQRLVKEKGESTETVFLSFMSKERLQQREEGIVLRETAVFVNDERIREQWLAKWLSSEPQDWN